MDQYLISFSGPEGEAVGDLSSPTTPPCGFAFVGGDRSSITSPLTTVGPTSLASNDTSGVLPYTNDNEAIREAGKDADKDRDGGQSDEEGEGADLLDAHNEAWNRAYADRVTGEDELMGNNVCIDLDRNYCESVPIMGYPDGWKPPCAPDGWAPAKAGSDPSEPRFADLDNPGKWSQFTFRPKYEKGKYSGHFMPSGATVVPKDANGKRMKGGWEFFYNGWDLEKTLPPEIRQKYPEDLNLISDYCRKVCAFWLIVVLFQSSF